LRAAQREERLGLLSVASCAANFDYVKNHPLEAVGHLGAASVKVVTDLGSAIIGSLGGIFRF